MAQSTKHKKSGKRIKYFLLGGVLAIILLPATIYLAYRVKFEPKVLPYVYVGETEVTGLTETETYNVLTQKIADFLKYQTLVIEADGQTWELPLKVIKPEYNPTETAFAAYANGRTGSIPNQLKSQWITFTEGQRIIPAVEIDELNLEVWLATLSAKITVPPVPPRFEINEKAADKEKIKVLPGQNGTELDEQELLRLIKQRVTDLNPEKVVVKLKPITVVDNPELLSQALDEARKLLDKDLILTVDDPYVTRSWSLKGAELVNFIEIGKDFDQDKISEYLTGVKESVDRPAQDARFVFNEGIKRVEEFEPAKNGLSLNISESAKTVNLALESLVNNGTATQAALTVKATKPAVSLDNANELGINELLGRGTSTYKGSIPTRVHNVALAASRINGTLVKPGETFSFNEAVGDVSGATGYQQAYIIRNGRTELGDGGGVCQDSTTVFRAALKAGLPITERKAHAYRVGYYEQDVKAGIDATVYAPSPDLKFTNDTPAHLLIQAKADTPNRALTVEIYGTSDGRVSEILNHTVWGMTPPPPDVYIDDPTLKVGQVKQVDWKAGGAKAKFDYIVTRNGETILEKTFYSAYKPWAAVFLRGTAP